MKKICFYEGLSIIRTFWSFIATCLIAIFIVFAFFHNEYFYIPIVIFSAYILVLTLINWTATKCLKKVVIDENGISISKKNRRCFYGWSEIEIIEIKNVKFIDTIFTYDFFLWLFRMSYFNVNLLDLKRSRLSVVIQNKYIKDITNLKMNFNNT